MLAWVLPSVLLACTHLALPSGGGQDTDLSTIELTFQSADGYVFDAQIEMPKAGVRATHGILMIGGGYGNDLDWTAPGRYTLNGKPNLDGKLLAEFLARRGYAVMRWSTIRHGDPRHTPGGENFTVYPYATLLEHARAALLAFRERQLVPDDHIILLGHSLGASRACHLADSDRKIPGLVLLAGAHLGPTGYNRQELNVQAGARLTEMDVSGNGKVTQEEFTNSRAQSPNSPLTKCDFARLDRDSDGLLMRWEIAAELALQKRSDSAFVRGKPFKDNALPWPEDVIAQRKIPVLDVCGGRDAVSIYGVLLQEFARERKLDHVQVQFLPRLGHTLGQELDDRFGPIDPAACAAVATWLEDHVPKQK